MQFTQVAYGGCWKCPQDWQRCSASTPCLAASQNGLVHSFGTGIGLVTLLQSLIVTSLPLSLGASRSRRGISNALLLSGQSLVNASLHSVSRALEQPLYHKTSRGSIMGGVPITGSVPVTCETPRKYRKNKSVFVPITRYRDTT